MLIPHFSIRFLLGLTAIVAGICVVVNRAMRYEAWAIGLLGILLCGIVQLLMFGVFFSFAYGISIIRRPSKGGSMQQSGGGDEPPSWVGVLEEE